MTKYQEMTKLRTGYHSNQVIITAIDSIFDGKEVI